MGSKQHAKDYFSKFQVSQLIIKFPECQLLWGKCYKLNKESIKQPDSSRDFTVSH